MRARRAVDRCARMIALLACAIAILLVPGLAGCYQGIQPDPTPPKVYILKWERNPNGTQGPQTTVQPGGQFTVPGDWLGPNQADIRVYGEGVHGVRKLTVSGTATGTCSAVDGNGTQWTAPSPLTASFPTHIETAPSGTTRSFMAFHLDAGVITNNSCGHHSYQGPPPNLEYFLNRPSKWTITAVTENGSGLTTSGTFTINVQ